MTDLNDDTPAPDADMGLNSTKRLAAFVREILAGGERGEQALLDLADDLGTVEYLCNLIPEQTLSMLEDTSDRPLWADGELIQPEAFKVEPEHDSLFVRFEQLTSCLDELSERINYDASNEAGKYLEAAEQLVELLRAQVIK